tara:strand:+ start:941 stop:1327 length:387 start_codon:yes stop_codon:yes gene_type:complete
MADKKTAKEILATYDRQIKKDMSFWIKYRPSRWGNLLPEKLKRALLIICKKKGVKKFFLISTLIFSLIFVGVIPTFNFIWANIFKVWLILLVIPSIYWAFAITSVYTRVMALAFYKFLKFFNRNLIDR